MDELEGNLTCESLADDRASIQSENHFSSTSGGFSDPAGSVRRSLKGPEVNNRHEEHRIAAKASNRGSCKSEQSIIANIRLAASLSLPSEEDSTRRLAHEVALYRQRLSLGGILERQINFFEVRLGMKFAQQILQKCSSGHNNTEPAASSCTAQTSAREQTEPSAVHCAVSPQSTNPFKECQYCRKRTASEAELVQQRHQAEKQYARNLRSLSEAAIARKAKLSITDHHKFASSSQSEPGAGIENVITEAVPELKQELTKDWENRTQLSLPLQNTSNTYNGTPCPSEQSNIGNMEDVLSFGKFAAAARQIELQATILSLERTLQSERAAHNIAIQRLSKFSRERQGLVTQLAAQESQISAFIQQLAGPQNLKA